MSLKTKVEAAGRLAGKDWGPLLAAWWWLLACDLLLRSRPFLKVQGLVERQGRARRATPPGEKWDQVRRLRRLVGIAARNHLRPMGCLRRSLALQLLLGREGVRTDLRIGVRKEDGKFLAHAWLEYEGESLDPPGGGPDSYEVLSHPLEGA